MRQPQEKPISHYLGYVWALALLVSWFHSPVIALVGLATSFVLWIIFLLLHAQYRKIRLKPLDKLLVQGKLAYEAQQYQAAIYSFQQVLKSPLLFLDCEKRDRYEQALFSLGSCQFTLQEYPLAIVNYSEFIKRRPYDADAYINRGACYGEQGKHELAIQGYRYAIELDSSLANSYFNLGNSYTALKEYESAIESYSGAIILDSKGINAYNLRGLSYVRVGDIGRALADYQKAIDITEEFYPEGDTIISIFYLNRGIALESIQDYNSAIQEYSNSIRSNSEEERSYKRRGYLGLRHQN